MKTVFILGAGFSVEAGAPTQKNLISEAFRLYKKNESAFEPNQFNKFREFLFEQLNINENEVNNVDLEDIFTPLDRCISENSQFRGISVKKISDVRESAFYVVGKTIQLLLNNPSRNQKYIDKFANHLITQSQKREKGNYGKSDPVSVISTNWDILLDNAIYQEIQNNEYKAVVDYCCYISSINKYDDSIKPGLEILGRGGFNVKLLKLHGSLNWLQCPRCMRLYVGFYKKEAMYNFDTPHSCRHCDDNFKEEIDNHKLYSNLIMPTFIKDFTNPQYKIIWQNAGIEISEAQRVVFIGYSLPAADFEIRQLLSRMTRMNAEIEVVDKCEKESQMSDIRAHWKKFFGQRKISFHFDGASTYINNLTDE